MSNLRNIAILLGLGLIPSSCISANFIRSVQNSSNLELAENELPQSGVGLDGCLDLLGAPTWVFEYEIDGLLLVYAWDHVKQWNINLSVPATDSSSGSFNYASIRKNQRGLVLWLDSDWQLEKWEHGYVNTLIGGEPRPATLEQIEASRP